ncbi:MAG: hypothetical protein V1843_00545 [bacterium]
MKKYLVLIIILAFAFGITTIIKADNNTDNVPDGIPAEPVLDSTAPVMPTTATSEEASIEATTGPLEKILLKLSQMEEKMKELEARLMLLETTEISPKTGNGTAEGTGITIPDIPSLPTPDIPSLPTPDIPTPNIP